MKNNNIVGWIVLCLVFSLLGFGLYRTVKTGSTSNVALDAFAQCLASKKVTMYGAVWCSHCQTQKALFGASFKYVPYVECPDNQQLCMDKGVTGYPTWIMDDGKKMEGEQSLETLSESTKCPLQ